MVNTSKWQDNAKEKSSEKMRNLPPWFDFFLFFFGGGEWVSMLVSEWVSEWVMPIAMIAKADFEPYKQIGQRG